MSGILKPLAALPIFTIIKLYLYLIIIGISVLAELDKLLKNFVLHWQAFASQANFDNKYVIFI